MILCKKVLHNLENLTEKKRVIIYLSPQILLVFYHINDHHKLNNNILASYINVGCLIYTENKLLFKKLKY